MKVLRNCWYVAAHSDEMSRQPLARQILDTPVVLFRGADDVPGALYDRCPHRLLPLSMGRVTAAGLQCGYHGATFDCKGACTDIPGESGQAGKYSVRSFPVVERHGFVWIWMGDPGLSSGESSIPESFAIASGPGCSVNDGSYISLAANYMLVVDNLLDVTHAQYVHPTTLGCAGLLKQRSGTSDGGSKFDFQVGERRIDFTVEVLNGEAGACFHKALAIANGLEAWEHPVDWSMESQWQAPSFHVFKPRTKPAGASPSEALEFYTLHAITPESQGSCHYFFKSVEIPRPDGRSFNEFWTDATFKAFSEDKAVLEAQQRAVGSRAITDAPQWGPFSSDQLGMQARKIVTDLIRAEARAS